MDQIPILKTPRLHLRPFTLDDAPVVQQLAGAYEIARTTANIPHPYEAGVAESWIASHPQAYADGEAVTFAIVRRSTDRLIGAIGMHLNKDHHYAEIGYWIGVPYWNQGYCTEAARAMLAYGFSAWDLNRIQARHMAENPASGRVMQKIGMQREGTLRESIFRWNAYHDAVMYAILRSEFTASAP
jgi:ribosomal-protein-alanine N-acetyltransferase